MSVSYLVAAISRASPARAEEEATGLVARSSSTQRDHPPEWRVCLVSERGARLGKRPLT